MATETATIRVTRRTRDLLAEQARERGLSLALLLAEIAWEQEAEAIWSSEKEAGRLDARSPVVAAEDRAWETALDDGIE